MVERIWGAAEQLCGKRLAPALGVWLPLVGEVWDEHRVGFLEADSVAHCGRSLAGSLIWSLVYTDLASTWTEGRAVWNKGAHGVLEQTRDVEGAVPFRILGFDFDNGGEWLNWALIRYLQARSRPYHKDDNAQVEQQNWMWPRQLLGCERLEDATALPALNALDKEAWGPLQNFFLPSMKPQAKWREGSRWVRRHDRAQTAYQRLVASGQLEERQRRRLADWQESLDAFVLGAEVERRLRPILLPARQKPGRGRRGGGWAERYARQSGGWSTML